MKITLINHSDTRGGASVVTLRLMEALRALGHDARMLVVHKASANPYVEVAAPAWRAKIPFLAEHLQIFTANGFDRGDLFKVSTASAGLPLASHPLVRGADAVLLGWVNQGMLSLKEIVRIAAERPVLWTMHDMWNMTGICHHAGTCDRYKHTPGCGDCPFIHRKPSDTDLSRRVWEAKQELYKSKIGFVAVSSWLENCARHSSLMADCRLFRIPNAFPVESFTATPTRSRSELGLPEDKKLIVMGAARLDDPVKGLPYAVELLNALGRDDAAAVFFGNLRDTNALDALRLPYVWLGPVADPCDIYAHASAVISTSLYETLPGTLIEGQAAGCTPVAFDSGGQRDIISSPSEGYLIKPYDTAAFAAALSAALDNPLDADSLRESVSAKFSAKAVAEAYIDLLSRLG